MSLSKFVGRPAVECRICGSRDFWITRLGVPACSWCLPPGHGEAADFEPERMHISRGRWVSGPDLLWDRLGLREEDIDRVWAWFDRHSPSRKTPKTTTSGVD